MGKFATFLLLFSGISLLAYYTGLISTNPLLTLLLNYENITTSQLATGIWTAVASAGSAIAIYLYTRDIDKAAATAIIPIFATIMYDFWQFINIFASQNRPLAVLLLSPILLLFMFTIWESWRGND